MQANGWALRRIKEDERLTAGRGWLEVSSASKRGSALGNWDSSKNTMRVRNDEAQEGKFRKCAENYNLILMRKGDESIGEYMTIYK